MIKHLTLRKDFFMHNQAIHMILEENIKYTYELSLT